jgi:hypothetical protein
MQLVVDAMLQPSLGASFFSAPQTGLSTACGVKQRGGSVPEINNRAGEQGTISHPVGLAHVHVHRAA